MANEACYACCMSRSAVLFASTVFAACVVFLLFGRTSRNTVSEESYVVPVAPAAVLVLGSTTIAVEVADTPEERRQGLSGRNELPWGSGLFFVFDESGSHGIWMPDMQYAIDVLWLDESMQVVHIVEDMRPESYPEVFRSPAPARYVLEVPAGYVASEGIERSMEAVLVE